MGNGSSVKSPKPPRSQDLKPTQENMSSLLFDGALSSQYCKNAILYRHDTCTYYTATCLKTQQQVMIKKIKLSEVIKKSGNIDDVINEFRVLQLSDHRFVIKLLHACREKMFCYLVMPSLSGGDLRYHLSRGELFPEQSIAYIIACIGSALQYLHSRHIIHRNIKPENIILDQYCRPVLIDMSLAFLGERDHIPVCESSSGPLRYVAPEIFAPSHRHSFHADFWSLGIVMYELFFHQPPFIDHCPSSYVYFVTNYYETMWDRIYESVTIERELETMTNSKLPEYNDQFTRHLTDPNTKLVLHSDGSLPSALLVKYPSDLMNEPSPSAEASDLLQGLLDPRLEKRLGVFAKKRAFSCHRFFKKFTYDQPDLLQDLTSPFLSESTACFTCCTQILKLDSHEVDQDPSQSTLLTSEMENKLEEYHFGHGSTSALNEQKSSNFVSQILQTRTRSRACDDVKEISSIS